MAQDALHIIAQSRQTIDFQKSIFCVFEDLPPLQGLLNEKVAECDTSDPHDFSEKLPSNAFSSPT